MQVFCARTLPRRLPEFAPEFAVELRELDQRPRDDTRVGSGLTARASAAMADRYLLDGETGCVRAREYFGVHEGADRFDRNCVQYIAAKDLEGAVDIANGQVEKQSHEPTPDPGDRSPNPAITARRPVSRHDVKITRVYEESPDFGQIELEIGVTEEDEITTGLAQSRSKCRTVAAIGGVVDGSNARIARR
jgi:hypothetical protein